MADTDSIFYQIGGKVKDAIAGQATAILAADNTWTGTNDFEKAVTVTYAEGTALDVKGTASTSGLLTAESLESTGDTDAKGGLNVTGDATISKNLTVNGDLIVSGTEAVIDTDSLDVTDNIIKLSDGASGGTYAKDSGLYFERGAGKSASAFVFDESEESFVVGTLEGSITETRHPYIISSSDIEYVTNSNNEVTNIIVTTRRPGYAVGVYSYFPDNSNYINTSAGLGGRKFATDYSGTYGSSSMEIKPLFANGEITGIQSFGVNPGGYWVQYDFSNAPSNSNSDIANTTPAPLTVGSLKLVGPVSLTTSDAVITFSTSGGMGNDGVTRVSSITIDGVTHQASVSLNGGYTNSPALGLNFLSADIAYGVGDNQIRLVFENGELARITNSNGNATYNYADASPQQLGNLDDFNAGYDA